MWPLVFKCTVTSLAVSHSHLSTSHLPPDVDVQGSCPLLAPWVSEIEHNSVLSEGPPVNHNSPFPSSPFSYLAPVGRLVGWLVGWCVSGEAWTTSNHQRCKWSFNGPCDHPETSYNIFIACWGKLNALTHCPGVVNSNHTETTTPPYVHCRPSHRTSDSPPRKLTVYTRLHSIGDAPPNSWMYKRVETSEIKSGVHNTVATAVFLERVASQWWTGELQLQHLNSHVYMAWQTTLQTFQAAACITRGATRHFVCVFFFLSYNPRCIVSTVIVHHRTKVRSGGSFLLYL